MLRSVGAQSGPESSYGAGTAIASHFWTIDVIAGYTHDWADTSWASTYLVAHAPNQGIVLWGLRMGGWGLPGDVVGCVGWIRL
ncbi:hypothetical protein NDU88_001610, partial [Pleurodeles waltl]